MPFGSGREQQARLAGLETRRARQAQHDAEVGPVIRQLREQGLSWRKIAAELDARGVPPPRKRWSDLAVQRIYRRLE